MTTCGITAMNSGHSEGKATMGKEVESAVKVRSAQVEGSTL